MSTWFGFVGLPPEQTEVARRALLCHYLLEVGAVLGRPRIHLHWMAKDYTLGILGWPVGVLGWLGGWEVGWLKIRRRACLRYLTKARGRETFHAMACM